MIENFKFKIGDIVEFKSSGQKMTVESIVTRGNNVSYKCKWFDQSLSKTDNANFSEDALKKYSED